MKNSLDINGIKLILWDFDGVLIDSNSIREHGFIKVLADYPKEHVNKLLKFHRENGGLSRYVKFRYFIEVCLKETASDDMIQMYADSFSVIMQDFLADAELLIPETLKFVKANYSNIPMHIVSGSDQTELRCLCDKLGLSKYFVSINGSPITKSILVENIMSDCRIEHEKVILIGDSVNDYDAAKSNGIKFCAYNNKDLEKFSDTQILQCNPQRSLKSVDSA